MEISNNTHIHNSMELVNSIPGPSVEDPEDLGEHFNLEVYHPLLYWSTYGLLSNNFYVFTISNSRQKWILKYSTNCIQHLHSLLVPVVPTFQSTR